MQKSMIHSDHMVPLDTLEGFRIRPGFFDINGATALSDGVCFTIHSQGATSCELLLYEPYAKEPFTILKYPDNYRIGNVFSMIVFDLDVEDFQYAFRLDGPYDKKKVFYLINTNHFWIRMPKLLSDKVNGDKNRMHFLDTGAGL